MEVDVQSRQPLGGFVGQEECRDERHELAGCRAEHQDAVAAVEEHDPDGDSAQRLHQRRHAVRRHGHSVRRGFDRGDALGDAGPHHVFEIEGLDDPESLDRFLHHLQEFGGAAELREDDGARLPDELASAEKCRRRHEQDDQRQERCLKEHDGREPDQRQKVPAECVEQEIEDPRRRRAAEGDLGGEFGGMTVRVESDALGEQFAEHPLLIFGDDTIGDAGHGHRLAVTGNSLQGEDGDHRGRDERDAAVAAADVAFVDAPAEQERRQRGARGCDGHE